jgi:hypothetical protein
MAKKNSSVIADVEAEAEDKTAVDEVGVVVVDVELPVPNETAALLGDSIADSDLVLVLETPGCVLNDAVDELGATVDVELSVLNETTALLSDAVADPGLVPVPEPLPVPEAVCCVLNDKAVEIGVVVNTESPAPDEATELVCDSVAD